MANFFSKLIDTTKKKVNYLLSPEEKKIEPKKSNLSALPKLGTKPSQPIITSSLIQPEPQAGSYDFKPDERGVGFNPITVAKTIVQGTAQSGAKLALGAKDIIQGKKTPSALEMDPTASRLENNFFKGLFGTERVSGIAEDVAETELAVKPLVGERVAKYGVAPVIVGLTALDFTTGGGKKTIIEQLIKGDAKVAKNLLKNMGVADDIAETYAPKFGLAKTKAEVEQGLKSLENIVKTTKKVQPKFALEEGLEPLAQEAKNYKSAEEFESAVLGGKIPERRLKEMGFDVVSNGRIRSPQGLELTDLWNRVNKEVAPKIPSKIKLAREARSFDDTKLNEIAEGIKNKEITEAKLVDYTTEVSAMEETLDSNPLKGLEKYMARSGEFQGKLPEVSAGGKFEGYGPNRQPGETGSQYFKRMGDDILKQAGFEDTEEGRSAFESYLADRQKLKELRQQLLDAKKIRAATNKGERLMTMAKGDRRATFRAVKEFFNLTDSELAQVRGGRDLTAMSQGEFERFIQQARVKAEQISERRQAVIELESTIQTKDLKKVENLQQAMKLPTINNMTTDQLRNFNDVLDKFKQGDEFFSVRKLETVDNTDLKGIKTLREARERLAQELKVPVENLDNIKVGQLDRYRYDTALAERNPFYGLMVDTVNGSMLNAEARYLDVEKQVNELINSARKSTPRKALDAIVPQDKKIFDYLESSNKSELAKEMTPEELKAANFIQDKYREMRDYLVQFGTLKKYRQDYITHIRRGFLEEWKEEGLLPAFKNIFQQYKQDEAIFNIISDTGQILPLEKFFQFSMRRSGQIEPTKNVAAAFLSYLKAFEKKQALDSIVPKLDIYTHSLTPRVMTPRGLEFDRSLKTFVNEWINTKKGRTAKIAGIEQGGKVDLLLRAGKVLTSILDLGLNIPVGIAARVGENMTNFVQMGSKKYTSGLIRTRMAQGKMMAEKYKNFIGRTPWEELGDAQEGIIGKLFKSAFGLFQDATVRSNKTFLLGSLTPAEFKSGVISTERLAELRREMGRYRVVQGAKSVVGSTSLGGVMTQYKTWAIPPLRTTVDNIDKIVRNKNFTGREAQELMRATLATLSIVFVVKAFVGDDEPNTFVGTVLNKAYRDSMTLIGALDPVTMTSEPRLISFWGDLGKALSDIVKMEEYKTKEGLKGVNELKQTLTPRLIKQFISKEGAKSSLPKLGGKKGGLPKLGGKKSGLPKLGK